MDDEGWIPMTRREHIKAFAVLLGVPALVLCIGLVVGLLA